MDENPFTPSFGEIPAHLAGRAETLCEYLLERFEDEEGM